MCEAVCTVICESAYPLFPDCIWADQVKHGRASEERRKQLALIRDISYIKLNRKFIAEAIFGQPEMYFSSKRV